MIFSLFAVSCFRIRLRSAVIYAIALSALNLASETVAMFVLASLFGLPVADYDQSFSYLLTTILLCKSLWFLSCLFLSGIIGSSVHSRLPLHLFFYPVSTTVCILILDFVCFQADLNETAQFLYAAVVLLLFLSNILLFINYEHQLEADTEALRLQSENRRLQTEKSYYDILEQQNQQLMLYAHDTKNHLAAIQGISDDPNVQNYVAKLTDQLKEYTRNCHSGNMMLDLMMDKYETECKLRKIHFTYELRTCNLKKMDDMDLVAVLGNLMDNALTAAENSEQKTVSLTTTFRNGYDVIVLSNSCNDLPKSTGSHLQSSKTDKSLHGIGLKSVTRTLRKYQGDFDWKYDDVKYAFTVTAMLGDREDV